MRTVISKNHLLLRSLLKALRQVLLSNKSTIVKSSTCLCFVCVFFPFILDVRTVDVPARVTQEENHTGFLIHLPSAVLALIFIARRIQPFLSLVDREVEFCVLELRVSLWRGNTSRPSRARLVQ